MRKLGRLWKSLSLAVCGSLGFGSSLFGAQPSAGELPAPSGLRACAPIDVSTFVLGTVAAKFGGKVLGCFQSEGKAAVRRADKTAGFPVEVAFAVGLPGGPYNSTDLENMQAKVTQQWKDFGPLSKELPQEYLARLNDVIREAVGGHVSAVRPVLVSIDRPGMDSYSVVSIRSYTLDLHGEQLSAVRVNGDAIVLRGSKLIRLTMQRILRDPSDVGLLQREVAEWARVTGGGGDVATQDAGKAQTPR